VAAALQQTKVGRLFEADRAEEGFSDLEEGDRSCFGHEDDVMGSGVREVEGWTGQSVEGVAVSTGGGSMAVACRKRGRGKASTDMSGYER
jgi:hypothetical protein